LLAILAKDERDSLREVQLRTHAEAKPIVPHEIPKLESI